MLAMSAELRIDKEFESLCPKLTEEELKLLTEQIEADGCRDAIVTWANHDDTIIDGFNRYKICRKRGLGFKTRALTFASRADVINWMVKNQIGRRNLNETQRAALAARMVTAKEGNSANLQSTTAAKAAEICNVSPRSVADAKKVFAQGSPALQEAIKQGDVAVSAAAVIVELPKAEQTKAVKNGTVSEVAKEVKAKKSKIEGGTAFPVDQIEAADAQTAKEDQTDSLNGIVPDDLLDVFSQCRKWQQAMSFVSSAKKTVTEFKDHRAAMFLDFQELDRLLSQARVNLKFAMPYTECPKCRRKLDKKCPHCKGQGWLNKATFTACASDADKGWLENRK
jgi:hypothetical protein